VTITPDKSWKLVSTSSNAKFFEAGAELLIVIPDNDISETGDTARENLQHQAAHWQRKGHGGAVLIFMDPVLEQDADARAVYANESANIGSKCFALVSESLFAMAASSVYAGLARPGPPTEIFRRYEDALPWIDKQLAENSTSS